MDATFVDRNFTWEQILSNEKGSKYYIPFRFSTLELWQFSVTGMVALSKETTNIDIWNKLSVIIELQSTLVISKSKGLYETL